MSYYDREGTPHPSGTNARHLDGSRHFHTREDEERENKVAAAISQLWGCELNRFGALCVIDWWATRHGRMIGLAELKSRAHHSDKYPNVWLNVRKWLALMQGAIGLNVPSIFIANFTDKTLWIPIASVDATRHRIGGTTRIVKSRSDIEPVIEIPMTLMSPLQDGGFV